MKPNVTTAVIGVLAALLFLGVTIWPEKLTAVCKMVPACAAQLAPEVTPTVVIPSVPAN